MSKKALLISICITMVAFIITSIKNNQLAIFIIFAFMPTTYYIVESKIKEKSYSETVVVGFLIGMAGIVISFFLMFFLGILMGPEQMQKTFLEPKFFMNFLNWLKIK